MPLWAERQVTEWVNDALAIVTRSARGPGAAETNLRRGLEAVVRHLAISAPPVADGEPPDNSRADLSSEDLRNIRQALDACLTIFCRHDGHLNTAQRRIQILVRACRRNADDALQGHTANPPLPTHIARR